MKISYNLNGLIEVCVDAPAAYVRYFDNEYQRIALASKGTGKPRVTLRIVKRLPVGHQREIHFKKLFSFRYVVLDLDSDSPTILFERHWLDRVYPTPLGAFIQGQILEPVMYQKLLEHGVLFMHAAGVSWNGKAYVFPAHGGTGKTTMALSLMRAGFDLMGDDLLMVDTRTGEVHPYARPLHLFTYNLRSLSVPFALEVAIRCKNVLRFLLGKLTGEEFLIATRAHVEDILDARFAREAAQIHKVTFLRRDGERELKSLDGPAARRAAAEAIVRSADLNESLYANVADSDALRAIEIDVVEKVLTHISEMEFIVPKKLSPTGDYSDFARELKASSRAKAAA